MLAEKIVFHNQACHQFIRYNMRFVVSQDFLTVVSVLWYNINTAHNQQQQHVQRMNQFIPSQTKQQTNYNAMPKIVDDEENEIECNE